MNIFFNSGIYINKKHIFPKYLYIPTYYLRNMKRKVIKQGHNTLTITLPAKWVEKNSVNAGDEIDIAEKGHSLCIHPYCTNNIKKKTIDITDSVVFLERELYSLYKKGYDEITLSSENSAVLGKIQNILNSTVVGFEIVGQTKNSCVIKNVAEAQSSEFNPILRRTLRLLVSMSEGIYEAMLNSKNEPIYNLRFMEKTNNKYTGFLRRVINRQGHSNFENEKLLYCFIEFVEKIADEYKYLCLFFEGSPKRIKKIDKDILKLFKRVNMLMASTFDLYYKYNKQTLVLIYSERKSIIKTLINMLEKSSGRDNFLLHHMLSVTQEIADIMAFIMTMEQ